MSWELSCYKTYENNKSQIGKKDITRKPLLPCYFIFQNIDFEITLNEQGSFVSARALKDAKDREQVIPATLESANRTSGKCAHPLFDSLKYIGLSRYCALHNIDDKGKEDYDACFRLYIDQLKRWADDDTYSIPLVRAVWRYVDSGSIVDDLVRGCSLLTINPETGELDLDKIGKNFVIFKIVFSDPKDSETNGPETLYSRYKAYYESTIQKNALNFCYATGNRCLPCLAHPKGILRFNNGAKLVSSNAGNFTYQGRFMNPEQAFCFGTVESLKAHNALKWVIENQGIRCGERVFVAWNVGGKNDLCQPLGDIDSLFGDEEDLPTIETGYRDKLRNLFQGMGEEFKNAIDDSVVVMSLEAATTGRVSITYYNELRASDFIDRIERWYLSLMWFFKTKRGNVICRSPSPKEIAQCAYGTDNEKLFTSKMQDFFKLIVEGGRLPRSLIESLVRKVSSSGTSSIERERILPVACAVIRKYINEKTQREEILMELDENNKSRSYLFGRLLAICDYVEKKALFFQSDRETNAMRYQAVFVQKPMTVWAILEKALIPYYQRLGPKGEHYYRDLIASIVSFAASSDDFKDKPLDPDYLVGYYLQRKVLYTK